MPEAAARPGSHAAGAPVQRGPNHPAVRRSIRHHIREHWMHPVVNETSSLQDIATAH
jgi:hypothetical protein